jgi:hypothetical protein
MAGLLQDLRHTLRMRARPPGFVAVVVLTLAIGIGANTAIFSVVRGVLLRPLPFADSSRIVRIYDHWNHNHLPRGPVSVPELVDYRAQLQQIQQISAYVESGGNLTGGGTPDRISIGMGTASLFPMLLGLVTQEGARMVGLGLLIGVGGTLATTRLLRSLLYDSSPTDPLVIVAGAFALILASALASYLPARRAARVDPMIALREE